MTATRILIVGEPLVEILEDRARPAGRGFGGDALNLAVYLKRASPALLVRLASTVGDDPDSEELLTFCRDEGIDDGHLRRVAGTTLGRYRVAVDAEGERAFTYDRSDSPFRGSLDELGDGLPDHDDVDVLCFSGITLAVLHVAGRGNLVAYAATMHDRGGLVVYDPNHRTALWGDDEARRWAERVAPIADMLLASTEDGRTLTDQVTPRAIADAFRGMGAREVVVTDGSNPCTVLADGVDLSVAPSVPERVTDTTAAGDAFDAGYLAARLGGEDPGASAAAGHAVAATVVGHRGALAPRARA